MQVLSSPAFVCKHGSAHMCGLLVHVQLPFAKLHLAQGDLALTGAPAAHPSVAIGGKKKRLPAARHYASLHPLHPLHRPVPPPLLSALPFRSGHCISCILGIWVQLRSCAVLLLLSELARIRQAVRLGANPLNTYKVHSKVSESGFTRTVTGLLICPLRASPTQSRVSVASNSAL